jgi:hypothetical protein
MRTVAPLAMAAGSSRNGSMTRLKLSRCRMEAASTAQKSG